MECIHQSSDGMHQVYRILHFSLSSLSSYQQALLFITITFNRFPSLSSRILSTRVSAVRNVIDIRLAAWSRFISSPGLSAQASPPRTVRVPLQSNSERHQASQSGPRPLHAFREHQGYSGLRRAPSGRISFLLLLSDSATLTSESQVSHLPRLIAAHRPKPAPFAPRGLHTAQHHFVPFSKSDGVQYTAPRLSAAPRQNARARSGACRAVPQCDPRHLWQVAEKPYAPKQPSSSRYAS
ncbi:hypothetical protein EJ06DRAFT_414441 [Trichodelitschia bisporula]|uniref:Uncharacterized protein n=1 Tax=Trichodelitschia bisporula TaxID=703511 RepID=A0A6G1HY54_9PEZI|nr:hypothetical protein EJ06DRAFT_414441 [Trichodelitschia bisporula]